MKMNKMHSGWKKEDLDTFLEKNYFCLHCWTEHDILWRFSKTDPSYELHYCPHQHPNDSGIKEDIVDTLEDDLDEAESIIARIKKKTPKMAKKLQKALPRMRKLKQFYETPLQDQIDNSSLPCVKEWSKVRNFENSSNPATEVFTELGPLFKWHGILTTIVTLPICGPISLAGLVLPATVELIKSGMQNSRTKNNVAYVQKIKENFLDNARENYNNFLIKSCEVILQDPYFVNALCLYENNQLDFSDYKKVLKVSLENASKIVKEMLKNI